MTTGDAANSGTYVAHEILRESQEEMVLDGISALELGGFQLAAAPTGIGKTAAALASALEVSRTERDSTVIMFLTGRQSQHKIVVDTVRKINTRLQDGAQKVRLVDLIGQQGMCINEIRKEHRALFSRLCADKRSNRGCKPWLAKTDSIRLRILEDPLHVDELVAQCSEPDEDRPTGICPWKAARETAAFADIVVCDYNHVFVEHVREASLPAMGLGLSDLLLVIDEAHNLPDRVRKGYKRTIRHKVIRESKSDLQEHLGNLQAKASQAVGEEADSMNSEVSQLRRCEKALERLEGGLREWLQSLEAKLEASKKDDQLIPMGELVDRVSVSGTSLDQAVSVEDLLQALESVRVEVDLDVDDLEEETAAHRLFNFLRICLNGKDDPAFALVHDLIGEESRLTTHLLDPGVVCEPLLESTRGAILMSGTLTPPEMYRDLLNIPSGRVSMLREYTSPFLSDRRPVLVARDVTSRYSDRGKGNTSRIREHIRAVLRNTPGHVAVFAPSYALLEEIVEGAGWWGRETLFESPRESKESIDWKVESLHRHRREGNSVLLAGVLRGKLAEGVDYPANILDAVICIGLPLPPPSARQDALMEYYQNRFDGVRAWRYASSQPAINCILQAMGRPIRKAEDRALVILLEKRLLGRAYRRCMPSGIHLFEVPDSARTERLVRRFFHQLPHPAKHFE